MKPANFTPTSGVNLYYETEGAGRPVVLLHGGVGASEMFGPVAPALSESRQVIGVHLEGHGHSNMVDRPLRWESMADDVAALIKNLGAGQVDIVGYSLGGGVAQQIAIRRPDVVRKLVLISAPFKRDGFYPEVLEGMAQMGPEAARFMDQSPLYQLYPGKNWALLFGKLGDLLKRPYDWSKEMAALRSPVMLVYADADAVRPTHILEFFALFGGGQRDAGLDGSGRPKARLAILPGMTHYDVVDFPGLASMIARFLDAPLQQDK